MKLKINGLMEDEKILWKKITCKCHKSNIELKYPFIQCNSCKFQKQEDSMPRESFKHNKKEIKEITIVRGKFSEIIAWTWEN
tara:strand:+ start:531 stop:776 length:246 start_codon:yes stop_codon:yes gene_type:complete